MTVIILVRQPDFKKLRKTVAVQAGGSWLEGVSRVEWDDTLGTAAYYVDYADAPRRFTRGGFELVHVPIDGLMPGEPGFDLDALRRPPA